MIFGEYSRPEFEYLKDTDWEFTEKIDGTNVRFEKTGREPTEMLGRKQKSKLPLFLIEDISYIKETIDNIVTWLGGEEKLTIYGEGYGNRIQAAGKFYIPSKTSFIAFDAAYSYSEGDDEVSCRQAMLSREKFHNLCESLSLKTAPIVGTGTLKTMVAMVESKIYSACSVEQIIAEGIVARPKFELLDSNRSRIICKLKHFDFEGEKEGKHEST